MKKRLYSDREALAFAYEQTVDHFGMWISIVLIEFVTIIMRFAAWMLLLIMAIKPFFRTPVFKVQDTQNIFDFSWLQISLKIVIIAIALCVIFEVIGGIIDMGIMRIRFDLYNRKESYFAQILSCAHLAIKHFLATIFYWAMVLVGLAFLIVPGIFLAVRFGFYRSVMVEKGCGPFVALRESWNLTCGSFWPLFVTYFLRGTIILPFVGKAVPLTPFAIFLTFPFLGLANVFVYKALMADKKE